MEEKESPSEQTFAHLLPAEKWHLFSTAFSLERTGYWLMSQAVCCSSVIYSLRHTWITFNTQWSKFNSYRLYECAVAVRTEIVPVYVLKFIWFSFWHSAARCFFHCVVCVRTSIHIYAYMNKRLQRPFTTNWLALILPSLLPQIDLQSLSTESE